MANLTMNVKTSTKGFEAFIFACKHTMSDLPCFILLRIVSILQNSILSKNIYSTEQYIVGVLFESAK